MLKKHTIPTPKYIKYKTPKKVHFDEKSINNFEILCVIILA